MSASSPQHPIVTFTAPIEILGIKPYVRVNGEPKKAPWFRVPLARNAKATAAWKALTPSRQKEIVRYLSHLKSPAARARNVARALGVLSGSRDRFMARSW